MLLQLDKAIMNNQMQKPGTSAFIIQLIKWKVYKENLND